MTNIERIHQRILVLQGAPGGRWIKSQEIYLRKHHSAHIILL